MHQRICKFLKTHNVLYPSQFGFREKYATSHALINITEEIKHSIDNNKYGCGIFLDPKKAFDTVNHRILIEKFEHNGIRGVVLDWFKSYLDNRKQCYNQWALLRNFKCQLWSTSRISAWSTVISYLYK